MSDDQKPCKETYKLAEQRLRHVDDAKAEFGFFGYSLKHFWRSQYWYGVAASALFILYTPEFYSWLKPVLAEYGEAGSSLYANLTMLSLIAYWLIALILPVSFQWLYFRAKSH